ncbi:MAG: flagellar export protein FliJ [Desulfobacteraceae bacterium]|nr:flagellar export protein FliJ [Desulfobacteraceae bacterium]
MKYQFKLEALRGFRQHQEEIKQKALAGAQRDCEDALNQLSAYLAKREKIEEEMQRIQTESTQGCQLAVYYHYLEKLAQDIEAQKQKIAEMEKECELARLDLLKAVKNRKTLDKLKDEDQKNFFKNLDQKEEKFINEMAINRFSLNQRQGR